MLDNNAITNVMLNAFAAMAKVAIVAAVGYFFALYPKEDPYLSTNALKYVSKISNNICLPAAVVSSIGSGLSVSLLSRMGLLILFSIFTSIISYSLAATLGKVMDGNSSNLYIPMYVAIASPNIVSLPLMILQTMCDESLVNTDYNGNSATCFAQSSSMIFVYSIGWYLVYWTYSFPLLQSLTDIALDQVGAPVSFSLRYDSLKNIGTSLKVKIHDTFFDYQPQLVTAQMRTMSEWCRRVLLSPVMVSIYIGVFVGLIDPLRNMLFRDMSALQPLGAALVTLGQPVVCLNSLIMAASLAKVNLGFTAESFTWTAVRAHFTVFLQRSERLIWNMPSDSMDTRGSRDKLVAMVDADATGTATSPLHYSTVASDEESKEGVRGDESATAPHYSLLSSGNEAEVGTSKAVVGAIPGVQFPPTTTSSSSSSSSSHGQLKRPHWRSVATLFVCRMILPVFGILLLLQIFLSAGIISKSDRMIQFVIIIEACSPPAQLIIVSLNQLELQNIASGMAYLYIFMYGAAVFTMTLWVTVALSVLY